MRIELLLTLPAVKQVTRTFKRFSMKNIYSLCLIATVALASCGPTRTVYQQPAPTPPPPVYNEPTPPQQPVEQDVTFQTFYDDLSPYGNWIEYPGYGYVWQPDAGAGFRPYSTNGDWIYTDAGWTWNSNYQWGWAPFHYGRWFYQGGYGWMWVPGSEWAPAWVSWRGNNEYYGWAPLSPDVSMQVAMSSYNPPVNYWNFMPVQYMGNPGWNQYYVNEGRNVTIINNTTIINNYSAPQRGRYSYAPGPDPNEVRRYTGNNIRPVTIRESNRPANNVSGNQYNIYRPRIAATTGQRQNSGARPQPATVRPYRPSGDPRPAMANQPQNPPAYNNGNNNGRPAPNPNNGYNNPRPAVQNPNNGYNNPRPAVQDPNNGYNNPRPAVQNPNNGNNGSIPGTRPAIQNPNPGSNGNNVSNPRPAVQTPASNPRPVFQNQPAANAPAAGNSNGRPDNLPRPNPVNRVPQSSSQPSAPVNNPRPVAQPSAPVNTPRPAALPAARPAAQPSRPATNQSTPDARPKTRDAN